MRDAFYLPFPRRNGLCLIPLRHSLCAKSPVCCGLSPCKRGRYASVAFPTFWGTPSPAGKTRIFRENDTGRGFPQALLKSRPGRLPHKMGRLPLERVGERMDDPCTSLHALWAYSARRRLGCIRQGLSRSTCSRRFGKKRRPSDRPSSVQYRL